MTRDIEPYTIFTFSSAWDVPVPTVTPFGVKLLTWMRMHDLPYRIEVEDNPSRGPKGKCPWAIVDGEPIGDSQLIIEAIRRHQGIVEDEHLDARQRAVAVAVRLMLEEHYHQVWEYEVFIHEGGWKRSQDYFDVLPLGWLVRHLARRKLERQLIARGMGRHTHPEVVSMGVIVLDAIDELMGDGPYLFGEVPTSFDATVFGFLSLTKWAPVQSELWDYFASLPRLNAYCDRIRELYFPG